MDFRGSPSLLSLSETLSSPPGGTPTSEGSGKEPGAVQKEGIRILSPAGLQGPPPTVTGMGWDYTGGGGYCAMYQMGSQEEQVIGGQLGGGRGGGWSAPQVGWGVEGFGGHTLGCLRVTYGWGGRGGLGELCPGWGGGAGRTMQL